ncbi:hypothetical protein LZ667_23430 [Hafnia alvei]|uniref:hypothetical protein n=1 Tax=Hafnia alvei TaxID=569 RepID=UPI001F41020D|nr:hypothetical protein [Hafnia alvei]MCE9874304.1 hypothetical protein [Hafnia alvei]
MDREELLYRIEYSYNFEHLFSSLTWRIDKLISLILLILGSAVFSGVQGAFWYGLAVAVLTAIQMTYQFAKSSEHSSRQSREYLKLLTLESRYSDDELLDKLVELEDNDLRPWLILSDIALVRTNIRKGYDEDQDPNLSRTKRFIAWFAGDNPHQ